MQDKEMWKDFECSNPENYKPDCYDEVKYDYDSFRGFKKRIERGPKARFVLQFCMGHFLRWTKQEMNLLKT